MTELSPEQQQRYSRQLQLPQLGADGQARLLRSAVLVVGCGGLGAPASLYLAAAGVGRIVLVDGDSVDASNLQRQITFTEADIGQPKASSTASQLRVRNSHIDIEAIDSALDTENCEQLINSVDLVLDCTDSVATRLLVNDSCQQLGKPWIYASVYQYSGQLALFEPGKACYRCLFPDAQSQAIDCASAGVLGGITGIVGSLQTIMAIDYLSGRPAPANTELQLFEADGRQLQSIQSARGESCADNHPEQSRGYASAAECSAGKESISAEEFTRIAGQPDTIVIDVRSDEEHNAGHLGDRCEQHWHIPLASLLEQVTQGHLALDANKKFLLYCQSGKRSDHGCNAMRKSGFTALSLHGGINEFDTQA